MNAIPNDSVIAIDGGGTRCRIALSAGDSITLVEVGSANVSTDLQAASNEIISGLQTLAGKVHCSLDTLIQCPAYVGLAGVTGNAIISRLTADLPFKKARIEDDRPSALRGAFGDKDGVLLHCGTGSFAAAQNSGKTRFVGGWGPVLGDEASAQWIGRRALALTLLTQDGFEENSPLSRHFLEKFGDAAGLVAFAGKATPVEFGALAQDVTRFTEAGDTIGRMVMQEAADELALTCLRLNWTPGNSICLTGGIGPYFANFLPHRMQHQLVPAKGTPLDGALELARIFRTELNDERR